MRKLTWAQVLRLLQTDNSDCSEELNKTNGKVDENTCEVCW